MKTQVVLSQEEYDNLIAELHQLRENNKILKEAVDIFEDECAKLKEKLDKKEGD